MHFLEVLSSIELFNTESGQINLRTTASVAFKM